MIDMTRNILHERGCIMEEHLMLIKFIAHPNKQDWTSKIIIYSFAKMNSHQLLGLFPEVSENFTVYENIEIFSLISSMNNDNL